jgi:hypothetical protein
MSLHKKLVPVPGELYHVKIDFLDKDYDLIGVFLKNSGRNGYCSFYDFLTSNGNITVYISDNEFMKCCKRV